MVIKGFAAENIFSNEFICAEILNDEDLEDGEIFEDEEPGENKITPEVPQEKLKPVQPVEVVAPVVKKPEDAPKNHRVAENDKPPREQNVQFFNRNKRKHDDEEDGRWKRDGKRNRRSHEFERDGDVGRGRQDGEMGEDDEEMMFVRGASPSRPEDDGEKWDRDGEEEERGEMIRRPRTYRGRGGPRRGERQRGRGRGGRGSLRGNKRKRDDGEMCVFFLQGKCHRGSDCPYAHEILPPRKPELCKFYMKDCCAKKDKCLYMHSEFPCKYFHTGLKCYANKKCKFNHGSLSDQMRNILAKHLDSAPKDILGEYPPRRDRDRGDMRDGRGDPRDSRERDMRDFSRGRSDRDRKIPSLFDIKVSIPDEMRNSDGNHTPMPSPNRSQDSARSSERDREIYSPNRERDRDRERDKERDRDRERDRDHDKHKHEKSERSKERKEERKAKREKAREHRKERREKKERDKERKRERSKDALSEKHDHTDQESVKNSDIMSPNQSDDNIRSSIETPSSSEKQMEENDKREKYQGTVEENGLIPQHLPKKQRELFLRIQQQQREADSSQASANDDDDEDDKMAEENWYSSDEETTPTVPTTSSTTSISTSLPSILQGLTSGASSSGATATAATTTTSPSSDPVMPFLNLLATASAAAKPLDVTNPNPAPASVPFIPPNLDLTNLSSVFEALTNIQRMNSANKSSDQQQQTPITSAATPVTMTKSEPVSELPKIEPPKPEPPRVRDPRLRADGGSRDGLDIDLRMKHQVKPQLPHVPTATDVDLRSLPFKPVQHTAASEIDASLASHSPLSWHLVPVDIIKADYSNLQIQPRPGVSDPRLRRIIRPPTDELGLPRDPRQRLIDEPVRDPRARGPLLATPNIPPTPLLAGPPPTPRYDEDHRIAPQFYRMDSDMRQFPPPTPRMDEEIYTPGPSRPVDPRRKQFQPRPDDIDLRQPMAQRVPFVNFK